MTLRPSRRGRLSGSERAGLQTSSHFNDGQREWNDLQSCSLLDGRYLDPAPKSKPQRLKPVLFDHISSARVELVPFPVYSLFLVPKPLRDWRAPYWGNRPTLASSIRRAAGSVNWMPCMPQAVAASTLWRRSSM